MITCCTVAPQCLGVGPKCQKFHLNSFKGRFDKFCSHLRFCTNTQYFWSTIQIINQPRRLDWWLIYFWPTVLSVEPLVQCLVCLSSVVCNVLYCGEMVRPSEKVSEGVNRKPGSKSSFFGSPPYFYFRFRLRVQNRRVRVSSSSSS